VHHGLYHSENIGFFGAIEYLSGAPYDVVFISFEDILQDSGILDDIDIILNIGAADTAHTGGYYWENERIIRAIRGFIAKGGGFTGIGEPSGHQYNGHFLQLAQALGVEKETGFTLGYNKYNQRIQQHFITESANLDIGAGKEHIYALQNAQVLSADSQGRVKIAANEYFDGRCVYFSELNYTHQNSDILHRALLWCAKKENQLYKWNSDNPLIQIHYYPNSQKYCICNNSDKPQSAIVYTDCKENLHSYYLAGGELRWINI